MGPRTVEGARGRAGRGTSCPVLWGHGSRDGRLGTLEGSQSSWGLSLSPGPLPMEAIEKMASLCMRDPDEGEDEGTDEEDVEADDDLLVSTPGQGRGSPVLSLRHPAGPHAGPVAVCPCRQS